MVGWLFVWLVGRLGGRVVGWLVGWFVVWLVGWLVLVVWLVGCCRVSSLFAWFLLCVIRMVARVWHLWCPPQPGVVGDAPDGRSTV